MVTLREPTEQDIPQISQLMRQLWPEAPIPEGAAGDQSISRMLSLMSECPEVYFNRVAADGLRVVGFISAIFYRSLLHKVGTAQINELVVDTIARGQGVGRMLVAEIVREASCRKMDEVEVSTASSNRSAIDFYTKQGFDQQHVLLGRELADSEAS